MRLAAPRFIVRLAPFKKCCGPEMGLGARQRLGFVHPTVYTQYGRATFPVLREDQWERFQESYALSLALPPHIPPQGGGGLYLGSNGCSEVCVSF